MLALRLVGPLHSLALRLVVAVHGINEAPLNNDLLRLLLLAGLAVLGAYRPPRTLRGFLGGLLGGSCGASWGTSSAMGASMTLARFFFSSTFSGGFGVFSGLFGTSSGLLGLLPPSHFQ
jgi:hypothetical protein